MNPLQRHEVVTRAVSNDTEVTELWQSGVEGAEFGWLQIIANKRENPLP